MNRLLTLTCLTLLVGCTPGLGQARQDWRQADLDTYAYRVSVGGVYSNGSDDAHVSVVAGVAEVTEGNDALDPLLLSGMEGVHDWIGANYRRGPRSELSFLPNGVPDVVVLDPRPSGVDDEYSLSVWLLDEP